MILNQIVREASNFNTYMLGSRLLMMMRMMLMMKLIIDRGLVDIWVKVKGHIVEQDGVYLKHDASQSGN